ncbi:hypothetical protein [Ferrimonas balearica]|uniref:hypothetical protein n=1 Tax=Ferrimonas balearica TaxID=44012 RepID=UPI001C583DBD|nr:hypothetical protein [Ferrimonas balearica]MBW3163212.1 hypothetical protein [Ferrimonas balearica]
MKRDGLQCKNKVNERYKPYCGVHKNISNTGMMSDEQKDKRLSRLIQTGVNLIVLLEHAKKYLPEFITLLAELNTLNFLRQTDGDFDDIGEHSTLHVFTSNVIDEINGDLAEKNLHRLYISLNDNFNCVFNQRALPNELCADIYKVRAELLLLIELNGYKPSFELVRLLSSEKVVLQGV